MKIPKFPSYIVKKRVNTSTRDVSEYYEHDERKIFIHGFVCGMKYTLIKSRKK